MLTTRVRSNVLLGTVFVVCGLCCNSWLLEPILASDGDVSRISQFLLWAVGIGLIGLGILFYVFRRSIPVSRVVLVSVSVLLSASLCEWVLRRAPMLASEDRLAQRLPFLPSAFSRSRLDPRDIDVRSSESDDVAIRCRLGYRDRGFSPKKPDGQLRIFVVGGSFVFDTHAKLDRHWPKLLEEKLHSHGIENARVVNGGTPGHDSFDSVSRFVADIHLFEPDVVVLCNSWNDLKYFGTISPETSEFRARRSLNRGTHPEVPALLRWLERSQLYLRLSSIPSCFRKNKVGFEGTIRDAARQRQITEWAPRQFKLNVANFVDACRNAGCRPVLCTQPRLVRQDNSEEERAAISYEYVELNHDALCRAYSACDDSIRAVARQKDAPMLELAARIPADLSLFADHVHPTEAGSQRIADSAAELLIPILAGLR